MPTTCPYHYLTHLKCNAQQCSIRKKFPALEIMDQKYFFMLKEIYETNPAKRNQMNMILKEKFTQHSPSGMIALFESIIEMKKEGVVFESCKKRKTTLAEVLNQVDQYKINKTQSTTCESQPQNSSPCHIQCNFINNYSNHVFETNPLKRRLSNDSSTTPTTPSSSTTSSCITNNCTNTKKRKLSPATCNTLNVFETVTQYSTSNVLLSNKLPEITPQFIQPPRPTLQKLPSMKELMNSIMKSSPDETCFILKKVFE